MLCSGGRPLPLFAWLAVPIVFLCCVHGLFSFTTFLLDLPWDVTLSPIQFGVAAATTMATGQSVAWRRVWLSRVAPVAYLLTVFAAGVVFQGVQLPGPMAVALGISGIGALMLIAWPEPESWED